MSIILAAKIPSAIIVASDRRITGTVDDEPTHYEYIKTDAEQKSFIVNGSFVISYCGNANIEGIPTSEHIRKLIKGIEEPYSTFKISESIREYWIKNGIKNKPSIFISGYNPDGASIIEMKATNDELVIHYKSDDNYGVVYHGEQNIVKAIIDSGKFEWSLMRIKDMIECCDLLITTTARVQALQKIQQTVSSTYDLISITDKGVMWIIPPEFPLS